MDLDFHAALEGDRCPFCQQLNETASGNTCEHAIGWWWDGHFEVLGPAREFEAAFNELLALCEGVDTDSPEWRAIEAAAQADGIRSTLLKTAQDVVAIGELLESISEVRAGEGWSTGGMLGGSGHNLFVKDAATLGPWLSACTALLVAGQVR